MDALKGSSGGVRASELNPMSSLRCHTQEEEAAGEGGGVLPSAFWD